MFSREPKSYAASIKPRPLELGGGFKPQPGRRLFWVRRVIRELQGANPGDKGADTVYGSFGLLTVTKTDLVPPDQVLVT